MYAKIISLGILFFMATTLTAMVPDAHQPDALDPARLAWNHSRQVANDTKEKLNRRKNTLQRLLQANLSPAEREQTADMIDRVEDTIARLEGEPKKQKNRSSGTWWKPAGLGLMA